MLANRVKETGTGTTGNITLSGAATGFQSFNNAMGLNRRFTYSIEDSGGTIWEIGIGYLSGTTTLVRETILDNSSGTQVALTLSGGSHTVSISATAANVSVADSGAFSAISTPYKFQTGANLNRINAAQVMTADRIYWSPQLITRSMWVDQLGAALSAGTGANDNFRIGLYDVNGNGEAGNKLIECNADPTSAAFVSASCTETYIPAGWYWGALLTDVICTSRSNDGVIQMPHPFGLQTGTSGNSSGYWYTNSQSTLPATGNMAIRLTSSNVILPVYIGHS